MPQAKIIGADFSEEMLDIAKHKGVRQTMLADAMRLPFDDASVDCVTVAFGLRTMEDYGGALWEMARVLEHSFQYFRRTQLQEMSVDGKVRALSKLLRDNFGFVMQGVGVVVPIFATYDSHPKPEARLYFYDAMGAQFEAADYAATGSGSPAVRGILYYENTWGSKPLQQLNEEEAVSIALRALDTAAESDTSTGGVDRGGKIYPLIKIVSREGITTLPESKIAAVFKETVA